MSFSVPARLSPKINSVISTDSSQSWGTIGGYINLRLIKEISRNACPIIAIASVKLDTRLGREASISSAARATAVAVLTSARWVYCAESSCFLCSSLSFFQRLLFTFGTIIFGQFRACYGVQLCFLSIVPQLFPPSRPLSKVARSSRTLGPSFSVSLNWSSISRNLLPSVGLLSRLCVFFVAQTRSRAHLDPSSPFFPLYDKNVRVVFTILRSTLFVPFLRL